MLAEAPRPGLQTGRRSGCPPLDLGHQSRSSGIRLNDMVGSISIVADDHDGMDSVDPLIRRGNRCVLNDIAFDNRVQTYPGRSRVLIARDHAAPAEVPTRFCDPPLNGLDAFAWLIPTNRAGRTHLGQRL